MIYKVSIVNKKNYMELYYYHQKKFNFVTVSHSRISKTNKHNNITIDA